MLKSRAASTPISVPGATSSRRKSILKTPHLLSSSVDSDTPASSPECSSSARRLSHVRFFDQADDSTGSEDLRRASNLSKSYDDVTRTRRSSVPVTLCRCDRSSTSLNDVLFSVPVLHITTSMSPEARYAALKTFEDNLCDRLASRFPDVARDLKLCRTPDDDVNTDMTFDSQLPDALRVADRLHRAVDVLAELRSSSESRKSAGCTGCDNVSVKAKLFEEWCDSLRATLDEVLDVK